MSRTIAQGTDGQFELNYPQGVSSVLISALVAIVTTLAIEYLAKPRLEARKDRILEEARSRRAILAKLRYVAFLFRKLHESINQDSPMQALEDPEVIIDRIRATIEPTVETAMGATVELSATERNALGAYVSAFEFWRDEPFDFEENCDMLMEQLGVAIRALGTPTWRLRAARQVRAEVRGLEVFGQTDVPRFSS